MSAECPVCREPIRWYRLFFTTAWGRWQCKGCESTLGVNVKRRFLAVGLALAVMFGVTRVIRVPPSWDFLLPLLTMLAVLVPYFAFVDRARVLERKGFRCRQCGYDLQGQLEPRCPECGLGFNETEKAWMKRMSEAQDASSPSRRGHYGGRAAMAAVFAFLCTLAAVGFTFYIQSARRATAPEIGRIVEALLSYRDRTDGEAPRHAIRLAADGLVAASDFITFHSLTSGKSVPVADITLAQFDGLSPERKDAVAKAAGEALAEATIAHRLGDFVFTYHAVDLTKADPGLWVVIWSPDPASNPGFQPDERVPVGLAGGKVVYLTATNLPEKLRAQNELRLRFGLQPLTNPFTVTHRRPMVAQP